MNLSKKISEACAALRESGRFGGLEVIEAKCKSFEDLVAECKLDGLTQEQAERWASDYCCATFHLHIEFDEESPYVKVEFDRSKLEDDFKKWLSKYIGDVSQYCDTIHLEGRETEFIRNGARHPLSIEAEDQQSISRWAEETFGPVSSNIRVATRANEEMAELLRALAVDDSSSKAAGEIADVVIVLYRLSDRLGIDLHDEINRKMLLNRSREWKTDGSGHGYHTRDKS